MSFRPVRALFGLLCVAAFAGACSSGSIEPPAADGPDATTPPAADRSTPAATGVLAFSAPQLGGGTIEGADFSGRDVAFWFWAPW